MQRIYARASVLIAVIALIVLATTTTVIANAPADSGTQANILFGKHGNELKDADLAGIPNEGPETAYEAEQTALRSFPAADVSPDAFFNSQATFQSLKRGKSVGQWTAIG